MSSHGPSSHLHQSQLTTRRVVAQSCVLFYVPSIPLQKTSTKTPILTPNDLQILTLFNNVLDN